MTDTAVILVGGKGTRLKKLTNKTPKPLLEINNRAFLDILISFIFKSNIKKIILLCSHLSDEFYKKYNSRNILGKKIILIKEEKKSGTGGALYYLKRKLKKNFLLFNGDSIVNININKFIEYSKKNKKSLINLLLVKNKYYKSNNLLSSLFINKQNLVQFKQNQKWMNGGIYYINKRIIQNLRKGIYSFEKKILKNYIDKNQVYGLKTNKPFLDIGTPKSFKKSKKFLKKNFTERVILLDRDGVINKDYGYVNKIKNFKILQGVEKAIRYANLKGYHVLCITNQSGIGRGYYTEKDLLNLHSYLNKKLNKKSCIIEKFYFCPHHPEFGVAKYKKKCFFRKPNPGMILKAIDEFNIKKKNCFMIGDQISDYTAAKKARIKFYFKKQGSLFKQIENLI